MDLGFSGDVVGFYHQYRRGYPAGAFDAITRVLSLNASDIAIDLGCGTGQITGPLAARTRAVIGMDPSADMLNRARQEAKDIPNIAWVLGADTDLPHLKPILGNQAVAAITIGQALHWMDHEALFRAARPLLRSNGGIAILTNGTPLWLQPAGWSQALRQTLGTTSNFACGTDEETQDRYASALRQAGYQVTRESIDYDDDLSLDQIIGGVFSAMSPDTVSRPNQRKILANNIRRALSAHAPFREHVHVAIIIGRIPG